jgi:phloretin hydrolase
VNVFFHAVRGVNSGVGYRSRYWIGKRMRNGIPERCDVTFPGVEMAEITRAIYLHSLTEYNNLASFLPEIYREMGGKIE